MVRLNGSFVPRQPNIPAGRFHTTRRAFLQRLATASAIGLSGCAVRHGTTQPNRFSFAPTTTEVTSRSAVVWLRTSRPAPIQVLYGTDPGLAQATRSPIVEVTAATDHTIAMALTDLKPDQDYFYRGIIATGTREQSAQESRVGHFRTAPETSQPFRFAWSGDMHAGRQPFRIYDRILEQNPAFFILLGDTVYADHPKTDAARTLRGFRAKHRQNREDIHLQNFLARVPVYAMWDDHEVANNFNRTHPLIRPGRQAFREYWPVQSPRPDPSVLHRTMSWGPMVDLFMLDCRQYRSRQRDPDGPGKTMLGATQKAWFKEAIRQSTATFKFVISSVPFLGWKNSDKWAGYANERNELLHFFRSEAISGVIFLSADMHMARHLTHANGINDFTTGPLATRTLCENSPGQQRRMAAINGFITCDALNYGLVSVRPDLDPPEVEVQVRDATNTVLYQTHIVATQRPSA